MAQQKLEGYIYKLTSKTSGKSYIGQTRSYGIRNGKRFRIGVQGRWRQHVWAALAYRGNDCIALNRAIRKYGKADFDVSTLCTCAIEELDEKEMHYIAEYNTYPKGYNCTKGGSLQLPPERRAALTNRMAATVRANWADDEYRKRQSSKISRINKERMWDDDVRANMLAGRAPLRNAHGLPPNIYEERNKRGVLVGYTACIVREGIRYTKTFSSTQKTVAANLALATAHLASLHATLRENHLKRLERDVGSSAAKS